jgi:hypothetical protein
MQRRNFVLLEQFGCRFKVLQDRDHFFDDSPEVNAASKGIPNVADFLVVLLDIQAMIDSSDRMRDRNEFKQELNRVGAAATSCDIDSPRSSCK